MSFSMPFYRVALLKEEKDNLLTEFKSSLSLAGQKKKGIFFYISAGGSSREHALAPLGEQRARKTLSAVERD